MRASHRSYLRAGGGVSPTGHYVQYEENPKEYTFSAINALLNVHTRIFDGGITQTF
jgi:hypothetical protein